MTEERTKPWNSMEHIYVNGVPCVYESITGKAVNAVFLPGKEIGVTVDNLSRRAKVQMPRRIRKTVPDGGYWVGINPVLAAKKRILEAL